MIRNRDSELTEVTNNSLLDAIVWQLLSGNSEHRLDRAIDFLTQHKDQLESAAQELLPKISDEGDDYDDYLYVWIRALGRLDISSAKQYARAFIDHPVRAAREAAVAVLGELVERGDADAMGLLRKVIETDSSLFIRELAGDEIDEYGKM